MGQMNRPTRAPLVACVPLPVLLIVVPARVVQAIGTGERVCRAVENNVLVGRPTQDHEEMLVTVMGYRDGTRPWWGNPVGPRQFSQFICLCTSQRAVRHSSRRHGLPLPVD